MRNEILRDSLLLASFYLYPPTHCCRSSSSSAAAAYIRFNLRNPLKERVLGMEWSEKYRLHTRRWIKNMVLIGKEFGWCGYLLEQLLIR